MVSDVCVIYFAAARELAGCASQRVELGGAGDVRAFRDRLARIHPRLAPHLTRMRFAVNGEFAQEDTPLAAGDEVTVLPPVAGGSSLAEVRSEPLSLDEVVRAVTRPGAGGIAVFLGVVRDQHGGKPVARLDYEAYVELANKEMARILDARMQAEPELRLAAVHRVGELGVGDIAIIVAASAPHRAQAFDACRAVVDCIKATVPIWKKEWAPDGSSLWVNLAQDERT